MKPYRVGIIFVHGIQGSSRQFEHIIAHLPESVLVQNLTLPGHGATTKEFRSSRAEQWLDAVEKECIELEKQCEHIVYAAHSMGCLLGLMTHEKLKCFSGMLLLCCPFHIRFTWRCIKHAVLASLKNYKTDDPFIIAEREVSGVSARFAAEYLLCARPFIELLKLIRRARRIRFAVPSDTLFFFSELDEIVGAMSVYHAQNRLGTNTKLLNGCGHNYFTEAAKAEIREAVLDMVEKFESEKNA